MTNLYRPLSEVVDETMEVVRLRAEFPEIGGVKTGIAALDAEATEAFAPGALIVVAGESGRGKTAFAAQLVAAAGAQRSVLWLSLEDDAADAATRLLANVGRIDVGTIRDGRAVSRDGARLTAAAEHLATLDVSVLDGMALTVEAIAGTVRRWVEEDAETRHGGVVVIDQLSHLARSSNTNPDAWVRQGLTPPPAPNAPETMWLEWQVGILKLAAQRFGVTVVLLHQLNEEHQRGTEPTERSIRGSRGIVHKADLVLVPWVPTEIANPFKGPGDPATLPNEGGSGFLIAVKARRVARFKVPVVWDGAHQRWADATDELDLPYRAPERPSERAQEGARRLAALRSRFDADRDRRIASAQRAELGAGGDQPQLPSDDELPPPPPMEEGW
jgi:replicative DNA helicase